ncbi:MAG: dipeptidase, partial [Synergistaceae bacterium]|nr:dipeptidase [Synergistaceae bacterium]
MKFKIASTFIVLCLLLIPSIAFAAAAQVKFYSTDETTVLGTLTANARTAAQGGGYFISAALPTRVVAEVSTPPTYANPTRLHDVPEFITSAHIPVTFDNADAQTVILSWKKKGDTTNTRYDFVKHAARTAATSTYAAFVPLQEDEVLELVPLKTIAIADFRALVHGSPSVDGHVDTPNNRWSGWPTNDLDIAGNSNAQGRYDRMKFGGANGANFGSYVSSTVEDYSRLAGDSRNSRILATANGMEWSAIRNPSVVRIVNTAQGFKDAHAAGVIGVMHQIEGAYSLTMENYYELIEQYYDLGYRIISFAHNPNSYTASGGEMSGFEPGRRGFTTEGELAIMRLNELGIVFDISHLEDQSLIDGLAISKRPVVGSHHGARGMYE